MRRARRKWSSPSPRPSTQEIEFSVRGLQAGAVFTFVIDGQEVATATADRRGRAEVEIDVRMPGAPREVTRHGA